MGGSNDDANNPQLVTEPDDTDGGSVDPVESDHRGAFGEFGATAAGLIDRGFRERIIIVGVILPGETEDLVDRHLDELERLIDTAGADVVDRIVQRRDKPDVATYVGKGKVSEIRERALATDCDTVVFDDELTPAQQFNLEKILHRSAIDRTAVILDIFAQNATSQEGKAQVELAQLQYLMPRLRGKGSSLSQQGGGIGTRGPGETQLEIDRRKLQRRINKLKSSLTDVARHRQTQHKSRRRGPLSNVAIVGYTNAGKSTLLNALTDAGVIAEDRLFATLDATTRRFDTKGGESILCTDTVGFIRKLPHQLVESFKTTLDVVRDADLVLHVVDGSSDEAIDQIEAVREVLNEVGALEVPELLVFNKADCSSQAARLAERTEGSVAVSAVTGEGLELLEETMTARLRALIPPANFAIPYDRGDLIAVVHRSGQVISEQPTDDMMLLRARFADADAAQLRPYLVEG